MPLVSVQRLAGLGRALRGAVGLADATIHGCFYHGLRARDKGTKRSPPLAGRLARVMLTFRFAHHPENDLGSSDQAPIRG